MLDFKSKLKASVEKNNSLLCVGLDSDIQRIPRHIRNGEPPQSTFNKAIIDKTYDLVCAYKINTAFYEARGKVGIEALKMTCDYIREKYPQIPIILDAKRGDIGNTNEGSVEFAFNYLGADAITLNPYLGKESLLPFLERKGKSAFILCRTSNPGAGEFQDLKVTEGGKNTSGVAGWSGSGSHDFPDGGGIGKPLYQVIAEHVAKDWNSNGNCGLVVGATYPSELEIVRHIASNGFPLLIPGLGTQGGDVEKTVKAGVDASGLNAIINSSRSIIFASPKEDFSEKARREAEKLKNLINQYRINP